MKVNKYVLLAILVISIAFVAFKFIGAETKRSGLHTEIITVQDGFGYQILFEDKVLVEQEFIPAIQGKKTFKSEKEAQQVGEKVMKKIENGEDPFITISELEDLQINLTD